MSKLDAQRAMREARFREAEARAVKTPKAAPTVAKKTASRAAPAIRPAPSGAEPAMPDQQEAAGELCGHRSMNGRTCTRERGHTAKSHRYS